MPKRRKVISPLSVSDPTISLNASVPSAVVSFQRANVAALSPTILVNVSKGNRAVVNCCCRPDMPVAPVAATWPI